MDAYDDDEQNQPIGFEQDPDSDDIGDGTWIYADGTRKYSTDYQKAMELNAQGKAKGIDVVEGQAPDPEAMPTEPLAKAPEEEPEEQVQPVPQQAPQPMAPAPSLMAPTQPARPLPISGQTRRVDTQDSQSRTDTGGESSSVQVTRSAMPQGQHDAQQGALGGAYDRAMQTAEDNRFAEAAALANRAGQMQQMGRDREAAASAAMAQNQQRQMAALKRVEEVGSRPTDNNKIWKDKGVLGTLAGALGVFMGGLSAYTMGRENTALKSIQEQKKQAIESQMADRNSELRGLERELGSLEAAVPVFEARMNEALKQMAEGQLVDERSATALRNGKTLVAQLEAEKVGKLQEAAKAYYGTVTQQQAAQSSTSETAGQTVGVSEGETRAPRAGGPGRPSPKQMAETDQELEQSGYTPAQRAAYWRQHGYDAPGGESEDAFNRREQGAAAKLERTKWDDHEKKAVATEAAATNFFKKAGLDLVDGTWVVGGGAVPPGFVESVNPFSDNSIAAAGDAATESFGRLQSDGAINKDELPRFRDQMGLNTRNRQELAARANALMPLIRERRPQSKRGSEKVPEDWRRKPDQGATE